MGQRNILPILALVLASVLCWRAAQSSTTDDEDAELYRLFVDAVENVDRSYVKDVSRRELIQAAIDGMLQHLDQYSNYIAEEQYQQFERSTTGKFGGIGIQIQMRDGFLTVISPLPGTPAYDAGILAGDRILAVDEEDVTEYSLSQIVELLTGPPGTDVTITVLHRPYNGEPRDVTLTRAIINIESVLGDVHGKNDSWDFMLDEEAKIGYIRVTSFVEDTARDLREAIGTLRDDGMKGLVIDLRYNPGGLLSSAVEVCDMFLEEGVIVSTSGRNTVERVFRASRGDTLPDFPLVVLVNQYSASASEIVSAALQDHDRALIIGERTWGKGSVQNVIQLEGGKSALKLTTASYQRPSGENIHRFKDAKEEDEWGVKPDEGFLVPFTLEQHRDYNLWRQTRDRVLGKADALDEARKEAAEAADGDDPGPNPFQRPMLEAFEDTQLEAAIAYIKAELAGEDGRKVAARPEEKEEEAAKPDATAKAEKPSDDGERPNPPERIDDD